MSKDLCKGGCGNRAVYKGWCKIRWKSGNKFGVACPSVEEKRANSISKFRIEEGKKGKNPMQNPLICAKNHSAKRNLKCSETLKRLGKLKLLPQQIENKNLKEKRRKNVSLALKKLLEAGRHPRQLESYEKRKARLDKMANSLAELGKQGKLPIQNMTKKQKKAFGEKISAKLREGIKSGKIKLSKSWKRMPYKNFILRSNWEKIVAEFLDKKRFEWEYETLRISYWDSKRKVRATTIPDFYLPKNNIIIEVKSNAEFNSQQTKDKTKAIIKKGFYFLLVGKNYIDMIKNNEDKFMNQLKNIN